MQNRRGALRQLAAGAGTVLVGQLAWSSTADSQATALQPAAPQSMQPPPPPLDAALVRAFVTAAHSDLARVTAMLGRLEVVRAAVAADPAVVTVEGPHGISLLRHAQAGKQEAVVMYLTSVGGA